MTTVKINQIQSQDATLWDKYVYAHPSATLYHLFAWKNVIEKTYGHKTYYLVAVETEVYAKKTQLPSFPTSQPQTACIVGVLPLVHLKHFLFGNSLISIPFFDLGGILADDIKVAKILLSEAAKIAQKLKVNNLELRHVQPLSWLPYSTQASIDDKKDTPLSYQLSALRYIAKTHKVRMLLELPESSEILMKSFKSKLRSQIKKPLKEGLYSKVGGLELLDDFYKVFSINMRDLGSPVHSKKLMQNVFEEFADKTRNIIVYKDDSPVACSMIIGFKDTLENPWASALRQYSRLAPNMLLYWTMLEYACDNGHTYFDFGRSSPDEGTHKFKKQWGAQPTTFHWYYIYLNGQTEDSEKSEKSKFDKAIQYWQKLPVSVTKIIGPMIRKHIGL